MREYLKRLFLEIWHGVQYNFKQAWGWASVQSMAFFMAFQLFWIGMPEGPKNAIPQEWKDWVDLGSYVIIYFARVKLPKGGTKPDA